MSLSVVSKTVRGENRHRLSPLYLYDPHIMTRIGRRGRWLANKGWDTPACPLSSSNPVHVPILGESGLAAETEPPSIH